MDPKREPRVPSVGKFSADRPFFTILQDLTPVKISLPISLNLETRLFRIFIESKFFSLGSFGISEKKFSETYWSLCIYIRVVEI